MALGKFDWRPPERWLQIETAELHTCGEPLRVFLDGLPEIRGETILEKRRFFRDRYDFIRTGTMFEPRGHADMYGAILTEPVTPDGDVGVFFMHNEGYSTMCGHAMIALGKLLVETGMIRKEGRNPEIRIDSPAGRVVLRVETHGNRVVSTTFANVPSFVALSDGRVRVPGIGEVSFDIAYGGAFYAYVDARPLGLALDGGDYGRLISWGKKIKRAVSESVDIRHPFEEDLSFLYGTIFVGDAMDRSNHSRNVCVFAEGEVDRSPTGTGVSGRVAIHRARGELAAGETIAVESILGTVMEARFVEETVYGPYPAVIPEVAGTAFFTGRNRFWFDPDDPLKEGFIFR